MNETISVASERVPVPYWSDGQGRPRIYPIYTMQVGEHFDVPAKRQRAVRSTISHAYRRGKLPKNAKFITRTAMEAGQLVCRCWRVR